MARILIIDDEYDVRLALRKLLEPAGYEVVEASTSEDGVQLFLGGGIDLLITDLFVPSKGGLEVIRELKIADPELKSIAISGSALGLMDKTFGKAIEYGALRTFEKPFKPIELLAAVKELID